MVSTQSTWGHRSGGRVEQVQIELKERLFKMNVKTVSCVLALLFAAANARYIGTGASGQCNEIQFFPKCSSDQFLMNMMQCNRVIQSGYPYQSKGQCMSNADQWISCMQSKLAICMSSNCPSILGGILGGMDQFMPVFNSFQGVNSLEQVYQTLDGVIDQVFTLFNINLPGQLDVIKQSGIKNWPVPLPGVNGLTIDQLLTDLICPDPGVMPDSIQNILLSVESSWQLLSAMGYPDTSAYVPFCDGDFTQYIVNNLLQHAKAFYAATSRSEWCSVQTSLYEMGSNVLNNKCSFDRLATIFSQVGVPDALIAMFKDSPQLILYTSGCSDTYQPSTYQSQPQYSSNYQQSSYPSQYSSNYQESSYPNQYSSNDQQSSYPSQYSSNDQQYQSGGYQSNYQSQYATGNNYNDLENLLQGLLGNNDVGNFLQGLFGGSNMFGNSFGGLFGNSFLNPFGNLFPNLFGIPFGNSNRNIFGGFSLNPLGNFFPSLFGNPFQNLFGGSYRSNYQQYPSNGYQSQYSSNNQQSGSSGYQQSNYQSQYAPANNLGSLFQNLLGNIGNIFPGLFGGSNLFGGSFQDIFGSLLQGLMGSSYPSNYGSQSSGYQGASSNYGSQSSGYQGASSNYGSQYSGYQESSPSGYESQSSEYQGSSSNYDSQSPGY